MVLESPGKPSEKVIKAAKSLVILDGGVHVVMREGAIGSSLESRSSVKKGSAKTLRVLFSWLLFSCFFFFLNKKKQKQLVNFCI